MFYTLEEKIHGETCADGKPNKWEPSFGPTSNIAELLTRKRLADGYGGYAQNRIVDSGGHEFEFIEVWGSMYLREKPAPSPTP